MPDRERTRERLIRNIKALPPRGDYRSVRLVTARGDVLCRYYPVPNARIGTIYVGGIGGGWDTPAKRLYPQLCHDLPEIPAHPASVS